MEWHRLYQVNQDVKLEVDKRIAGAVHDFSTLNLADQFDSAQIAALVSDSARKALWGEGDDPDGASIIGDPKLATVALLHLRGARIANHG